MIAPLRLPVGLGFGADGPMAGHVELGVGNGVWDGDGFTGIEEPVLYHAAGGVSFRPGAVARRDGGKPPAR